MLVLNCNKIELGVQFQGCVNIAMLTNATANQYTVRDVNAEQLHTNHNKQRLNYANLF